MPSITLPYIPILANLFRVSLNSTFRARDTSIQLKVVRGVWWVVGYADTTNQAQRAVHDLNAVFGDAKR
jgi:hypothetical protein